MGGINGASGSKTSWEKQSQKAQVPRLGRGQPPPAPVTRAVYFDTERTRFPLSVTAPVRAKTRPVTLAPVVTVSLIFARMLPSKSESLSALGCSQPLSL
jgi:hypothetical protein